VIDAADRFGSIWKATVEGRHLRSGSTRGAGTSAWTSRFALAQRDERPGARRTARVRR
jgi:hypothetical protein